MLLNSVEEEANVRRFWAKVQKTNTCWIWTATRNGGGYGCFSIKGRRHDAHRFSWALINGPIPAGLSVLHICDSRSCVNPAHLFLGTQCDNMRDMVAKNRQSNQHKGKTHCNRGHEFTPENTYTSSGKRTCRTCCIAWHKAKNGSIKTNTNLIQPAIAPAGV